MTNTPRAQCIHTQLTVRREGLIIEGEIEFCEEHQRGWCLLDDGESCPDCLRQRGETFDFIEDDDL